VPISTPNGNESAVAVPAAQFRLGVDRDAVDVELEVEVATDGDRVAGLADGADPLPRPDPLAPMDQRRPDQVGVEVAAVFALAVDLEVVAVEDRVIADVGDPAGGGGDQLGVAGGDDVEPFVGAATVTGRAEFADRPARPVRTVDREDVAVIGKSAVEGDDLCGSGSGERREKKEGEEGRALQWCSMTRSTMLYSFASSALMK
jgi:hypothetical protein